MNENKDQNQEQNKKKKVLIIIIAALLVVAIAVGIAIFAGGDNDQPDGVVVTEVVTDDNGEAVTQADGTPVTQVVTQADGTPVTQTTTKKDSAAANATNNTSSNNSDTTGATTSQQNVSLKTPGAVKSLKASDEKTNSVKLAWSKVSNCEGYVVDYCLKGATTWSSIINNGTKTSIVVEGLDSNTEYTFRVRAYNGNPNVDEYVKYGKESTVDATTIALDEKRTIQITVSLPKTQAKDTIQIFVNDQLVNSKDILCDGSDYVFTTEDKYKGVVTITAKLTTLGYNEFVTTDKDAATINFADNEIDILDGEDD